MHVICVRTALFDERLQIVKLHLQRVVFSIFNILFKGRKKKCEFDVE